MFTGGSGHSQEVAPAAASPAQYQQSLQQPCEIEWKQFLEWLVFDLLSLSFFSFLVASPKAMSAFARAITISSSSVNSAAAFKDPNVSFIRRI